MIPHDVIPLAIWRMILDILRNHLELDIIEALFLELDHCSKTRTHQKLVPNPKLIWMFHILSNLTKRDGGKAKTLINKTKQQGTESKCWN